ncbi:GMC oxidoreductase, partial [Tsukamurella sp. 8J]|uniref:GMC oxidoreductase n=1 Tax=Tsukamurella sp. 8J TaxID=3031962 RepID=UPI0023B89DF4
GRGRRARGRRGRAIGVETDAGPVAAELVVLCAGSVGTPRLLLRSGIGAARTVAELGAEPVVDLPGVGRGGTDHPEVTLPLALDPGPHDPSRPILEAVAHLVLPEGEVEIRPYTAPFGRAIGGVDDPVLRVGVAAMTSKQRAEVLGGAGVRVHRSGSDAALLAAGVASVRDLLPTRGEAVLGVPLHLCGTARMGDSDEAPADGAGRIRGVEGLYVADGSAVPVVPTRGPHATVIAVAERLSEVLLRG